MPFGTQRFPFRVEYYRRLLRTRPGSLVGAWPMWEREGTVADDIGANRFNGAYTGVALAQAGIGDGRLCPYFDGATDYTNIYSAALATEFSGAEGTVGIWARVSTWTSVAAHRIVYLSTSTADANNSVMIYQDSSNNKLTWLRRGGGAANELLISNTSMGGQTGWFHCALTWSESATEAKAYLNGVQQGATQTPIGTWAGSLASAAAMLGAENTAVPVRFFDGWLAHAAVWKVPLTPAEIAGLARR